MTRPVRSRVLKDVNGDISDHLRNHIHLTNCIHLKNHMHKHSPILSDRSLMRDLIALQRSRSLRDPSASPPSWHSPSVVELLPRKGEKEGNNIIQEGRRSVGGERPRQGTRLSGNSPPFTLLASTRVAPEEDDEVAAAIDKHREDSLHDILSGKSDSVERKKKQKGKQVRDPQFKTLSEQLNSVALDSDAVVSSNIRPKDKFFQTDKRPQEAGSRNYGGGVNRGKRRRFRASRRPQAPVASRDVGMKSELSVASNSLGQGPTRRSHHTEEEEAVEGEEEEEYREQNNVTRAPRNGCGIPWNWSRIHHRGRNFFDKAGRSLSCGLSERRRNVSDLPVASESLNESSKSEGEALPLLGGSQGSSEKLHDDYSGELGIFSDHLLRHDRESDLASEARSGGLIRPRNRRNRHQNLTQKYMPRSFRDLMGQNLVAQALSNAVARRKIGILYVFYGPHGTGKTSCARIFAQALNCQSSEDSKPCGYCNSCIAHNSGKCRHVKEVGPVSNFDFENIIDLLDNMVVSHIPSHSQYRVFIFDDCDTLSSDCWSAISKVIDRAPRRVVFILVCSSLEVLPHIIISRCHKFFFPKLKDADIIYTLQWVSSKEHLEVDKDALKLIASRSDGSLRDALMTLDQLGLLGQRISVALVQELVGLISDEKLVDLLDLALSADTVNTVKNLRVILEMGVEPLALMSQLATVVTDILAGTYDFTKERNRRKFFQRLPLSKEAMERLRQALKTLSEAEKQLRMSNDKTTWLTAALLQLAPDQQYMMPTSSADNSPSTVKIAGVRESNGRAPEHVEVADNGRGWPLNDRLECTRPGSSLKVPGNGYNREGRLDSRSNARFGRPLPGIAYKRIDDIWLEVIDRVPFDSVKEFLFQEGRLISISFGAAPTVQLLFSSNLTKTKAEKLREHILQAFETVLGSTVTIEIRCESKQDTRSGAYAPLPLPAPRDSISQVGRSEIVELEPSPRDPKSSGAEKRVLGEESSHMKVPPSYAERRKLGEKVRSQSIVRGKVSLAHVIQEAGEGRSQRNSWSKSKAVSIAEKLEQENLRLEPRSRSLLCWKASQATRRKLSQLKIKARRPRSLLKLVPCGQCLSTKSLRS